jgi:hypothetical protein
MRHGKNHIEQGEEIVQNCIINKKKEKIKYCPIIAQMLKKNNSKLKNPIIFSFLEFTNLNEQLNCRLVCKQWNEAVNKKLTFLGQEKFFNYVINKNNFKRKSIDSNCNNNSNENISSLLNINKSVVNHFDNSDQKFSKKKVLAKLINSKNYALIKNKVTLGEMIKPRVLAEK